MAVTIQPAGKAVLALLFLSATGAAAWHLGLKDVVSGSSDEPDAKASTAPGTPAAPAEEKGIFDNLFGGSDEPEAAQAVAPAPAPVTGALGTKGNPLVVNLNSWIGWGPGLLANGGLETTPESINGRSGLYVRYVVDDTLPSLASLFGGDLAHCGFRTTDWLAQEHPALVKAGQDGKGILIADNSRGSDALIARGDIHKIENLAGKRVAYTEGTVGHFLLSHYALANSSLTERQKQAIQFVPNKDPNATRNAFINGDADAAMLWEPDTTLATKAVPGSSTVFSSATASNVVYDEIVCNVALLNDPANESVFTTYVENWIVKGVAAAENDLTLTSRALVGSMGLFKTIADENGGPGFISGLFGGVLLTGLEENLRIAGLANPTDTDHLARVYGEADTFWRESGFSDASLPKINPKNAFDYRFIKALGAKDAAAKSAAAQPEVTFTEAKREEVVAKAAPVMTKPVTINFATGSSELNERAKQALKREVVPMLESMGTAYFSVEGNTDSTGSAAANKRLSAARAQAVVDYFVTEWEIPAERFKVRGNGPSKPACDEGDFASAGYGSLDECRAANRRTDVAVYSGTASR